MMVRSRLRILLVDDDEEEYILTQDLLTDRSHHSHETDQLGFELEWVGTYEEALDAFKAGEYDVYLVDYHLGERDGLELLREAVANGCQAPIIVITGQGNYAVDIEAMKSGATDYLVKSEITAPLLERTIRYAIERKRSEEEIRKHASQAELLATLSHAFAEAGLDYAEVLETIAHQVAISTGDACVIRLLSGEGNWLDLAATHHPDPEISSVINATLAAERQRSDEGVAGLVLQTGKPVLVPDVFQSEPGILALRDYRSWLSEFPIYSLLVVPLRAEGRIIGTLGVLRFYPHKSYNSGDLMFFQDLADRAALAIENARLFAAEASRARELDALQTATASLLSTIDLEILLSHILDIAQGAIPAAEKGILHLLAPDTGLLQIRAVSGYSEPRIVQVNLPKGKDFMAIAVQEKQPLLIRDIISDPDLAETASPELRAIRSAISAPLILEGNVLGAISLSASRPSAFTEADLRLLVSFATTTTASIKNAMLYAEVQKMAITDSLTEVYNRRGFFELGQREIERAHRFSRPLSAIMLDVDFLKDINDTYTHAVGDQALRIMAERLRASTREVDILGRYGGDEFVVLLPETDLRTACVVAERIRSRVSEPLTLTGPIAEPITFSFTVSLGVVQANAEDPELASLLDRADNLAYRAKRNGRNRVEVE